MFQEMMAMMLRVGLFIVLILSFSACASAAPSAPAPATSPPAETPVVVEAASPTVEDENEVRRQSLVYTGVIAYGIKDKAVVEAMGTVPRHEFVPDEYQSQAYANHPLPIGYGQTISQPYTVALMTEAAELEPDDVVLEVGTGSGYQAAVLAELVDQVYSMEIIGALAERSAADLERLGYDNVTVEHADGYFGWEEHAPFDAIIVTAAPDHVPQPLVQQLKVGGNLIIPVGPVGGIQTLWRVKRVSEDEAQTENLGAVSFVPLTREER
jgi:protein-L-isoaspartate(D-aspartate) O-methyltransferase